jgi:hypothetical protein
VNAYLVSTAAVAVAVLATAAFGVTVYLYQSHVRDLRATIDRHRAAIRAAKRDRDLWQTRAERRLANLGQCRRVLREWQSAHRRLIADVTADAHRPAGAVDWEVWDRNTEHWATPEGHVQRDAEFDRIMSGLHLVVWTGELDPETCLLAESFGDDDPGQVAR